MVGEEDEENEKGGVDKDDMETGEGDVFYVAGREGGYPPEGGVLEINDPDEGLGDERLCRRPP